MANSVDPDQTAPIYISNVSQLFAADNIFRCIFFLGALRVNPGSVEYIADFHQYHKERFANFLL